MNPLTLVKRTQKITARESALGISEEASWHAKYKDSAYIFVGGIPFDLTEGDLLAVFAQYGEIVDVNLVRDKGTGKSKGFAFIAYEDQRSTILAVDNLNGAQVLGRTIRVDHVSNYKKKEEEEEDEETQRQRREERGVCRAFQRGQCTRGDGCKFSHDEQRAANTGWGHQDKEPRWGHDKFEGSKKIDKRSDPTSRFQGPRGHEAFKSTEAGSSYRMKDKEHAGAPSYHVETDRREKQGRKHDHVDPREYRSRENCGYREDKRCERHDDEEFELKSRENRDKRDEERSKWRENYEIQPRSTGDRDRREDKTFRRHDDSEYKMKSREGRDGKEEKGIERPDEDCHVRKEEKRVRRYDDDGRMLNSSEHYGGRYKGSRRH